MAAGKEQYVYRLMKAKCSCGDKDFTQYLNVPKDHGVLFHDPEYPLMNANDHVANENILTFGRCKSISNPGGAIAEGIASVIIPGVGGALLQTMIGCKCEPMTLVPWIKVDEDYFIDGAPALTLESKLPCYYGGIIEIVLEQVEAEAEEGEQQEEEEEKNIMDQLPSEVQEKIDSFCDKEASNPQSAAEAAIAAEKQATAEKVEKWVKQQFPIDQPKEQGDVSIYYDTLSYYTPKPEETKMPSLLDIQ